MEVVEIAGEEDFRAAAAAAAAAAALFFFCRPDPAITGVVSRMAWKISREGMSSTRGEGGGEGGDFSGLHVRDLILAQQVQQRTKTRVV